MKFHRILNTVEKYFVAILTAVLIVVVFFQVLNRMIFKLNIMWPEEAARYLMVWQIFSASVLAFERGANVGIDVISSRARGIGKFLLHCFHYLACAVFAGLILFHTVPILAMQLRLDQRSPALNLNMAYVYGALAVWGLLTIVELVYLCVGRYREWKGVVAE